MQLAKNKKMQLSSFQAHAEKLPCLGFFLSSRIICIKSAGCMGDHITVSKHHNICISDDKRIAVNQVLQKRNNHDSFRFCGSTDQLFKCTCGTDLSRQLTNGSERTRRQFLFPSPTHQPFNKPTDQPINQQPTPKQTNKQTYKQPMNK
jgi:hypothetical protein